MFETIKKDLLTAMKEQDKFKLNVLRMLKSALQMEEISNNHPLTDEEVINVIRREVKKRNSSILEYQKFNKLETVNELTQEIEILSNYLPEELSEEETLKIIDEVLSEFEPVDKSSLGKIINEVRTRTNGNVDMSFVSKTIKDRLS